MKVLSVGCGTGELECYLSGLGHCVVGLDMSKQMLDRACRRGLELLVQADSQVLPFSARTFDVAIFAECVGYLDMPAVFTEANRVLKTRGRLLLTTYSGSVQVHRDYTKAVLDDIAASLAAGGFPMKEHRFLNAKRTSLAEVRPDRGSTLLYVLSRKQASPLASGRTKHCN